MPVTSLRTRLCTALLAGATAAAALAGASGAATTKGGKAVAFYPGGVRAAAGTAPRLETFRTGVKPAGEPNIGITRNGTIWASAMAKVVRSTDRGKTWQATALDGHVATLDPYLYVDPATSRVYKSDLAGTCQLLSWTDDGTTWSHAPAACNQSDHQTIAAGPPVGGLTTIGYPNVVYDCSQTLGYNGYSFATGCARSLDGGLTWAPTGTYAFSDPSPYGAGEGSGDAGVPGHCNGDNGPIFVAPYGRLFVPRGWCGQPWLAYSDDGGTTWTRVQVAKNGMNTSVSGGFGLVAPGSGQSDHEAAVVADKTGHVYYLWIGKDRLPYLAVSRDRGTTFGPPLRVAPPGLKEAWGPSLDVDAKGRVAMAYMGSTTSPGAPWTGSYADTSFTGYLAVVSRPADKKPLVWAGPVTAAGEPFAYGTCGPGRCNDGVLDFIDVAFAPDGSVWGAFIDHTRGDELVMGHLTAVR
jgi:hypothetical protein